MSVTEKMKQNNEESCNIGRSCFECKHQASFQPDIICYTTCDIKGREWTFGEEDSKACELFLEDQ